MKTPFKSLSMLGIIVLLSSFNSGTRPDFFGTYGTGAADPAAIQLIIREDHTFAYQDLSDKQNQVVVSGNWTLKGHKVELHSSNADVKFHHVWSFAENGKVAKSQKGLCFYRLCRLN